MLTLSHSLLFLLGNAIEAIYIAYQAALTQEQKEVGQRQGKPARQDLSDIRKYRE